jgi:hypothetical protein
MDPKSNPAITAVPSGNTSAYEVAFEANNDQLWTAGTDGTGPRGEEMAPGTSPAITGMDHGTFCSRTTTSNPNGYAISFQAPNHLLQYQETIYDLFGNPNAVFDSGFVTGTDGSQVTMNADSSPAVTAFGLHEDPSCNVPLPPCYVTATCGNASQSAQHLNARQTSTEPMTSPKH